MKKLFFWIFILILAVAGFFIWRWQSQKNQAPQFREVKVERGNIELRVLATGVVQPENRLELKPPIAGRVESILVEEGQYARRGQILAWLSSSERAALLDAARAKGSQELAHWEDLFRPTPLLAPLDGLIIVKNVVPGQVVTAQDSVLVMSDHLLVNVQVDETDIGKIHLGQKVTITLDAYPDKAIPGKVTRIAFESITVNNVTIYEVEVLPQEVPDFMRSGMTANVDFVSERRENVLMLPAEAIQQQGNKNVVLLPSPGQKNQSTPQEIKTGLSDGKNTEIISGLQENQTVLIAAPNRSSANPQGGNPFMPTGRVPRR